MPALPDLRDMQARHFKLKFGVFEPVSPARTIRVGRSRPRNVVPYRGASNKGLSLSRPHWKPLEVRTSPTTPEAGSCRKASCAIVEANLEQPRGRLRTVESERALSEYSWFAVKVRTRSELFVGDALRRRAVETFVPTWTECRHYSDRIKKIDAAMFPGYLFCRLQFDSRLPVLKTPGVEYILGNGNEPTPVAEDEVNALQCLVSSQIPAQPWPYLKRGEKVRVAQGAFSGIEALIVAEKGIDRLVLSVTLLQRSVAVEIDRSWIRPI